MFTKKYLMLFFMQKAYISNMKFKNEIKKASEHLFPYDFSLTTKGGYFIGVKKMIENSQNKLQVLTFSRQITVFGKNIKIIKFIEGDLAFLGMVERVEIEIL